MATRRTNRGLLIDMESIMAQQSDQRAVGNMDVNGRGDKLGRGGSVVQKAEDRARDHYKKGAKSVPVKRSLKGKKAEADVDAAETKKSSAKSTKKAAPEKKAPEQKYKEVELPNGDIEMVPVDEDGNIVSDDWEEPNA